MPRRVATYDPQFRFWNEFASVSSYVMAFAILLMFINILWSLRNGKKAGPNPGERVHWSG
jgi:cytochrome c oxidase subunit 1